MRAFGQYIICFLICVCCLAPQIGWAKRFTVVIDAGHGGRDPGAIGIRGKEKNINLTVALKLGNLIEKNMSDVHVVYTRKTDIFIPLHKRPEIANDAKADLFISLHTNSLAKRTTRIGGAETYTLGLHRTNENLEVAKKENAVILIESDYKQRYAGFNPKSAESYIIFEFMQDKNMSQSVSFARMIQRQFKKGGRVDRGVHQAGFLVLRAATMPSVLVELGYISNAIEEEYLLSESGTSALARGIYDALVQYKRSISAKSTDNGHAETSSQETEVSDSNTAAVVVEEKPVVAENTEQQNVSTPTEQKEKPKAPSVKGGTPQFRIQILTSGKKLPANAKHFKGLSPISSYTENNTYKYTYGNSTNYNEIYRTFKEVRKKFPGAFIIAFKNGEKMDVNVAIKEFKKNKR